MQGKIFLNTLATAALTALVPAQAQAYDVVHTQAPSGGLAGANTIDGTSWLAERFSVGGTTHIDSVSAYVLSSDVGNDLGKTFTIALYGNSAANLPAIDWNSAFQGQLFHGTATYSDNGWNGLSGLNWNIGAGSYWVALEVGSSDSVTSLQAPTGATPAVLGVAFSPDADRYFATGPSDTFGLRVTALPVPEPESLMLLLAGLGVLGAARRCAASHAATKPLAPR